MRASGETLCVGRVLHEDDDFLVVEIAKDDSIKFTLQQNEAGETVGGDQFLTMLFVRWARGGLEAWRPWEDTE